MHFLMIQHILPLLSRYFFVLRLQESMAFTCTLCFKKEKFKKKILTLLSYSQSYTVNISKSKSKKNYSSKDMQ